MLVYIFITIIIIVFVGILISFNRDINKFRQKLKSYDIKKLDTVFGKMSYVEEGTGEAILLSHGIFGGYDQGYLSLKKLLKGNYKKIAISRFGYPGSSLPKKPTPKNQSKVFVQLLDVLNIDKTYIISTSAGGASGLRFTLDYPERVKGLILLSSGVPDKKRTIEEVKKLGMMGPPSFIVNDFTMWFVLKYFGFAFRSMLGSGDSKDLLATMLPVKERHKGVIADTNITNIDMTLHYDEYQLENIKVPILVIHAKDDPMARYENIEAFLKRVNADTAIYETGGHLIEGHDCSKVIEKFIDNTK